jgi:hypothetical protein
MPKQDADIFEVVISQMRECRNTNPVLGKALRILGHAEPFEPVRNLLHRSPTCSRGAFNPDVDLIAERHKINRLGQKRLSATL